MAKTNLKSVDEYVAAQPEDVQAILQRVRGTIRKALPPAEEVISYGIPTYKLNGRYVIYFAGWKEHYSIYPVTERVVTALKKDLVPYEVNKGTVRFPLSEPVPVRLISRITKMLTQDATERAKAKLAASKKTPPARTSMKRCAAYLSVLLSVAAAGCGRSPTPDATAPSRGDSVKPTLRLVREAAGPAWSVYETQGQGRIITVYAAHDRQPKPVVFLLQGSGCNPVFTVTADGRFDTTSLFQDVVALESKRVHFAIVEKPGVAPLRFTAGMTHQQMVQAFERAGKECTPAFFENATRAVRVDDVLAAIAAVTAQPWARGIVLAGHSEGTLVATGVLRRAATGAVTGAGLFARTGPVQFWTGSVSSGRASRESFQASFDRMRMLQNASDDFMYQGLPARRYKTFWLESTTIEDVRDSEVPLFVAQGTRDGTVMGSDLFAMEAIRRKPNRPMRYVVVEGGDHGFGMPDGTSRVNALFADFLDWILDPKQSTSTAVVK